jgi:LysM repeat protein
MEPTQITAKPPRSLMARVLAPLALVVVAIVVFAIIDSSLSTDSGNGERTRTERAQPNRQPTGERTYVVQPGDTLETISEKTGVSVERLQDLNPEVDPQALLSGAELRLR